MTCACVYSSHFLCSGHAADCLEWSLDLCELLKSTQCLQWPPAHQHQLTDMYGIQASHCLLLDTDKPKSWLLPLSTRVKLDPLEHDIGSWLKALAYVTAQLQLQQLLNPQKTAGDFFGGSGLCTSARSIFVLLLNNCVCVVQTWKACCGVCPSPRRG